MKISIAVPSLNYGQYIEQCLESIISQEYADFEVLICDGGSVDGTLEIISKYVRRDKRVKLVSTHDHGQADAVDKAFRVADGDIFCYLNADDFFLTTQTFGWVVETFAKYRSIDLVAFKTWFVNKDGRAIKPVKSRAHPLDNLSWIRYRGQVVQPSAFWRRTVYEACPFNTQWHYCFDSAFFYGAYQRFSFLERDEVVAAYRIHEVNKSVGVSWKRIREMAEFEQSKFGPRSFRARYLRAVARCVKWSGGAGSCRRAAERTIYCAVNFLSLLTGYRLPGI